MAYVTYSYYRGDYYGADIDEASFARYELRARQRLDRLTSNRLIESYPPSQFTDTQIKMCVCEMADTLYNIDQAAAATKVNSDGTGMIVSKSSGSESVSYKQSESIYYKLLTDKTMSNKYFYEIAEKYLTDQEDSNGVNLLYMGVG